MVDAEVAVHGSRAAGGFRDDVLRVWRAAFGPIDDDAAWSEEVWERHRLREGYRLATARTDGELVGFAWGYTGARGQYWTDLIADHLPPASAPWIDSHFQLVELAVLPAHRRTGVGGRLHDALLAGLPHEHAILGTSRAPDNPAVGLYRSRGWTELARVAPDTLVLGLELPRPL